MNSNQQRPANQKLRIAWFSPLAGDTAADTSIAAYFSSVILPLLRERFELELFHNSFDQYETYPSFHYLSAAQRHAECPFDLFFYQLEDLAVTNFVRMHLGLIPGVVLFHDFLFTSFGPEPILNSPWRETLRKFSDAEYAWTDREAEHEQAGPLGHREAGYAALALFSNTANHIEFKNQVSTFLQGEKIPSHFLPVPGLPLLQERTAMTDVLRIGFCGLPRIENRAHKLLSALSACDVPCCLKWLLAEAEQEQAEELVREFDLENVEFIVGRTPDRWQALLPACDVAVHLLFSVYGQLGPYMATSILAGMPTLVTRFGSTDSLPEQLIWKIQAGETEAFEIREVLTALAEGRWAERSEQIKVLGQELYEPQAVAEELAHVFITHGESLRRTLTKWQAFERSAQQEVMRELQNQFRGPSMTTLKRGKVGRRDAPRCPDYVWESLCEPVFKELDWQ